MGWKDLAKLGKDWAEAKKDELLTGDEDAKADARARADAARDSAKGEVGTSFLENVLPPDLAKKVTEHRPENVAAREAEQAVQQEAARRADLAGRSDRAAAADDHRRGAGQRLGRAAGRAHRGRPGPEARPRLPGRPAAHALAQGRRGGGRPGPGRLDAAVRAVAGGPRLPRPARAVRRPRPLRAGPTWRAGVLGPLRPLPEPGPRGG